MYYLAIRKKSYWLKYKIMNYETEKLITEEHFSTIKSLIILLIYKITIRLKYFLVINLSFFIWIYKITVFLLYKLPFLFYII